MVKRNWIMSTGTKKRRLISFTNCTHKTVQCLSNDILFICWFPALYQVLNILYVKCFVFHQGLGKISMLCLMLLQDYTRSFVRLLKWHNINTSLNICNYNNKISAKIHFLNKKILIILFQIYLKACWVLTVLTKNNTLLCLKRYFI